MRVSTGVLGVTDAVREISLDNNNKVCTTLIDFDQPAAAAVTFFNKQALNISHLFTQDKNMNATCGGVSAADDEDEDDEDGEAVDMEGEPGHAPLSAKSQVRCLHPFLASLSSAEYEESGLLDTDEVARSRELSRPLSFHSGDAHQRWRRRGGEGPHTCSQIVHRPPWTPARWSKPKPKLSPGARTPSCRPGRTTCTSPTTNTTRPRGSGSLDTTKYVRRGKPDRSRLGCNDQLT